MTELKENKDVSRPFLTTPDPRVYFPGSTIEKARRAAVRCLKRGEGIASIVGAPGTGKTLLARTIAAELESENLVAVASVTRRVNVKSFLQQFMFSLRQSFQSGDETELRLMTLDYLERAPEERCMLLIDDAHNLTLRVFDEIRRLIDQSAAIHKQLSVALFGAVSLEDRLNLPALFPFQQRIVSRSYLEPFRRDEVGKYIDAELKRARVAATFTQAAKDEVAKLSSCVPRVVTQLCDRALFLAFDGEIEIVAPTKRRRTTSSYLAVDVDDIERGWNHLLSIPDSEEEPAKANTDSSPVVEFGLLDDDDDDEYNNNTVEENAPQTDENVPEVQVDSTDPRSESSIEFSSELSDEDEDDEEAEEIAEAEETQEVEEEKQPEKTEEAEADVQTEEPAVEEVKSEPVSERPNERVIGYGAAALSHEQRRSEAKRAFWEEDPSAVFVAGAGTELQAGEEKARVQDEPIDEENERASQDIEIDEALDARLREKYGLGLSSFESVENEVVDESAAKSYNVYSDGMKFEVRDRSELDESEVASEALSAYLVSRDKDAAEAVTPAPIEDAPDAESKHAYDAQVEFSSKGSPRYTRNEKHPTRRPIVNGDDGSEEYRAITGFPAEDAAFVASSKPLPKELKPKNAPGESAPTFSDQAHAQIVAKELNSVSVEERREAASDRYLNELDLLEQEIAEEANLIRRIRNIHIQLRSAVVGDARRKDAE